MVNKNLRNTFKELDTSFIIRTRQLGLRLHNDDVLRKWVSERLRWLSKYFGVEVDYIYDGFVQYPDDDSQVDFDPTQDENPDVENVARQIYGLTLIMDTITQEESG